MRVGLAIGTIAVGLALARTGDGALLPDVAAPVTPPAFDDDPFAQPSLEHHGPQTSFLRGRYGLSTWDRLPRFAWDPPWSPPIAPPVWVDALDEAFDVLPAPAFPAAKPPCLKRARFFTRYGAESDSFALLGCDGSIAPAALDRLSVLMRPEGTERATLPLPDEPDPDAVGRGEWVPHVKLVAPRLIWAVEQIASQFPWRPVYVMSGYRPEIPGSKRHHGLHAHGRALDFFVMGVANERIYKLCRKLPNVGCGYYPNNKFIHLDVRRPGGEAAYWIDPSAPGEPSRYVDRWPGVETGGGAESGEE